MLPIIKLLTDLKSKTHSVCINVSLIQDYVKVLDWCLIRLYFTLLKLQKVQRKRTFLFTVDTIIVHDIVEIK